VGYPYEIKKEDIMRQYDSRKLRLIHWTLWILAAICGLIAFLTACDTRREVLDDQGVWVCIEVDWTEADIRPEGTSIYLFNQNTGERIAILCTNDLSGNLTRDSVKLHAGQYSLLVMNETERSHDYLSFRGTNRYHTAEAYVKPYELSAGSRYAIAAAQMSPCVHTVVADTEVLAVAHIDGFEVDYEMIRTQARPVLRLSPQRLSIAVDVIIHLQNMRSLHSGTSQAGAINHMAEGRFLASESPNAVPATFWFVLTPATYDPATHIGTLRAAFASFGPLKAEAAGNILSLYFLLRDGTEYPIERDVTDQLHRDETTTGHRLTVEIGLGLRLDDPFIVLPELPGGDDGMFEVDIGDWDDNTNVDIPL
jgi:hypothetical protein